jgi:hypothetical protein
VSWAFLRFGAVWIARGFRDGRRRGSRPVGSCGNGGLGFGGWCGQLRRSGSGGPCYPRKGWCVSSKQERGFSAFRIGVGRCGGWGRWWGRGRDRRRSVSGVPDEPPNREGIASVTKTGDRRGGPTGLVEAGGGDQNRDQTREAGYRDFGRRGPLCQAGIWPVLRRMETNERQAGKPKRRAMSGQSAVIVDAPNPMA